MPRFTFTLILMMASILSYGRPAVAAGGQAPARDFSAGWDSFWGKLDLKVSGEVTLTADDSDIQAISTGGSFVVTDRGWLNTRQLRIDVEPSGALKRRFTLNAREQPYDEAAARWFKDLMPQLIERGGLAAESRAKRLFAEKGLEELAAEVSRFASDQVKTLYVNEFTVLAGPNPSGPAVDGLAHAIHEISSDAGKGQVLQAMLERVPEDQGSLDLYLRVINQMDSSLEQSNALSALLQKTATDDVCLKVLPSVRHMSSAMAGASVMELAAQRCTISARFLTGFLDAVSQLSSGDRQTHALVTLIDTQRLDARQIDVVREFSQNRVSSRVGRTMLAEKIAGQQAANR
jgi:hypothetical protein